MSTPRSIHRVSTLDDLAALRTGSAARDLVHLERLVATWRPLADLSFSDLLLLAPIAGEEGHRFVVLAQVRPVTGQTTTRTTSSARVVDEVERPLLDALLAHGRDRRGRHARARREGAGARAVHPGAARRPR